MTPIPLHQLKAEFFRTLGHPVRIRILELLADGEMTVATLLTEVGIEASHLSQQLGILRRAGLVDGRRQGANVLYSLSAPNVGELLAVARSILTGVLVDRSSLLDELRAEEAG